MHNAKRIQALLLGAVVALSGGAGLVLAATDDDQVTLSTNVQETISLDCGADVNLGNLTPGTPVTGSTTCTSTTNANGGYDLAVKRDDADTTMDQVANAAINITDRTAWTSGTPNASAYANGVDTGLAFRVAVTGTTATHNATWWGSNDTTNAIYAGFPVAYDTIMDHDTYSSSATAVVVSYKLDVPATQRSGAYDGTVTYQATTKP